ncbi:hypothetical protein BDY19DRAFT_454771 [Irpex rosettiformis]|uniref:Uncharacterized protein n=1 Tax=Irpex rosettiformis TaxID=378272 RepID=A0ACB8TTB2_9APHY|nr:hypothetical protein BDY19DRAFT_454771 [Irpex rosettiformis]
MCPCLLMKFRCRTLFSSSTRPYPPPHIFLAEMYPQQRRRPNKHTDRFAWEASWERDLKAFYDRPLQDLPRPTSDPLYPRSLSFLGTPSHLLNLDNKSQEICALQSDIRRAVLHTCGDFEQKWRTLATRKRREFVLEGLYQASCREWLEEKRGLCPEFTLTLLAAGDGSEYLRLLRAVLPSTSNTKVLATKSPVFIPHDRIDYIWALPHAHREILGLRAWTTDILLDRTFFASMTIWSIFAAVYGEYEQLDASFISPHPIEEQEQLQEAQRICQHCGKHDSSSRSRRHLRACSGCLTVGRKIYYCSRDCQANNWKHGVPIPHEVTCGRIPSPSRIPASIDSADPRIPKPDASFERSTDLEHQISFLYQSPYVDYTFIFPYPLPDKGITVRPPPDRRTFLTLRDEGKDGIHTILT